MVKTALEGWRATAVAAAVVAALCWPAQQAHALSLGRIKVLSALGEPLLAEVDVSTISAEESATLQASIAPPEAFRAAGLEYNPALQGLRITLQQRPDGRAVLRLSSERPANAPFVDVILQVNWASGRVVRDYTILLDPPAQRQAAPSTATAPQVPVPPAPTPVAPPVAAAAPPAAAAAPPPAPASASLPARAPAPAAAPRAAANSSAVTVKPGDTASRIAAATKAPRISLDQMLVAMLRSNPEAFVQGNVNRLKAGAVLDLPTPEQAAGVPAPEASRMITAQSRDFNAFRSRLASKAPAVQTDTADRSASGRLQAQIDESRAGAGASDKLTLSKGDEQARSTENRIAREKATAQADERVAELSRNISDLNRLGVVAPGSAPAASAASAAAADTAPPPAVNAPTAPASTPEVRAPVPPAPAPSAPSPPTTERAGWLNNLTAHPLVPAAAAALIALLAALGLYRVRQRRKAAAEDAIHADGSNPDSFFGASGGQRVDTADAQASVPPGAAYSPSQLDTSGDVDPVAEADVYLAYGRDLQAEEILTEALRNDPERVAIHAKLAEIYAKRRDSAAFLAVATQADDLTGGVGPEWAQIAALGQELIPGDLLWTTPPAPGPAPHPAVAGAGLAGAAIAAAPPMAPEATAAQFPDLDFDLDLEPDAALRPASGEPAIASSPSTADDPATAPKEPPRADALDFDLDVDIDPYPSTSPDLQERGPASASSGEPGFDLGSLNLDLGDDVGKEAAAPPTSGLEDPLATKLALAEEFHAIGDADGARALAEEVLAEASGPLKGQAQRFLDELG